MTEFRESKIVPLIGVPNGALTQFSTPTAYATGTIKVFLNGQQVEPTDDKWGWSEVSDSMIDFTTPPNVGDVLTAFYQESSAVPGISNVKGSPFHPSGLLP